MSTSLSIIIPAYNEEKRLPSTLDTIIDYLKDTKSLDPEILLVVDKSKDKTFEIAKEYSKNHPKIKILYNNMKKGKGYAIRRGILESKGDYVLFTDADLSTPITELDKFLLNIKGNDIIIGSRTHKDSKIKNKLVSRVVLGSMGSLLLRIFLIDKIKDTQCGFKLFKGDIARKLFSISRINGFGFDFEIIYLAQKFKYNIYECPVFWVHKEGTKVTVQSHFVTLAELFSILKNNLMGHYRINR